MTKFFFFAYPKELSFRALDAISKAAIMDLKSQDSNRKLEVLTVEDAVVLDQLRTVVPSTDSEDLGMVFDHAVFRAYVYLQWLNILGLDTSLKLDEVKELVDIFEQYEKVQQELENRFKEFAKVKALLN